MMKKSAGLRVLVVDDELLIRWSIAQTLMSSGHTVAEAEDGAGALRALMGPAPFDAVVLDYRLPDSNDLSLLASIRRLAPDRPVILMTAFGSSEVTQAARDLGVYEVLSKPFDMYDLEALLVRACNGPHA
jgi:two-component system, NtrC family, response regulator AtoC